MIHNQTNLWLQRCLLLIALTLCIAWPGGQALAADQDLFSDLPAARAASVIEPIPYYATRVRYVNVNASRLSDPQVMLNLFPDLVFTATAQRVRTRAQGSSWFGSLPGVAHGRAILVNRDGRITGNVRTGGELYQIRPLKNGGHAIYEVDQVEFPPENCPLPGPDNVPASPFPDYPLTPGTAGDLPGRTMDDSGTYLDIMVVYTAAAASASADILAEIQLAVDETNQSYVDSDVTPRIRLVHTVQTSYAGSGDLAVDVTRLRNTADGYMDEIHALRDQYHADMVALVQENGGGYCGRAYTIMAAESNAFCVVARSCATGYYSFGHELGHLQGARHDRYVDGSTWPYVHGHGWTNPTDQWRTVMAYNNACADAGSYCYRLPYWSNISYLLNGDPMGSEANEDNALVLSTTAYIVANFRQENTTLVSQVPAAYSEIPKQFSFTVNNSNWAGVAIAPASDHNLQADDNEAFDSPYADSNQAGTARDFITANGYLWGSATHYARVNNGSADSYSIEADATASQIDPGSSASFSVAAGSLVRMFQTDLASGSTYQIALDITSGSANLSLYVFNPSRSSGHRGDYDWQADLAGAGGDETITFTAIQNGVHGLALINENGQAADFSLSVCLAATYYRDADGDGYGDAAVFTQACAQPVGYVLDNTDCNDADSAIHPTATETCNGIDDDCNGQTDEDLTLNTYYRDLDGDGYGDASDTTLACGPPTGYVADNTDCNDAEATIHPGAGEACNGIDDNCDTLIDNQVTVFNYYRDADGDGFGDAGQITQDCTLPVGYVADNSDCDDSDPDKNPSSTEACNGLDDNCNGVIDEGCPASTTPQPPWQLILKM